MNSFIKKHKILMNVNNIKNIAYETLFTKYIIKNVRGEKKLWEIDSTDQEELMRKLNGGYPLPGFIYTFLYPPLPNDKIKIYENTNIKKYIDYVPLVFCLSIEKTNFKGINLNTLPSLERLKFLEIYYNGYKNFFKNIEETTENNELALNKAFILEAISGNSQKIIKTMNKVSKANFSYGYRTYKISRIKILRMIEYCEWSYIPYYEPRNAFMGMNQKQIHDLYYKTLK